MNGAQFLRFTTQNNLLYAKLNATGTTKHTSQLDTIGATALNQINLSSRLRLLALQKIAWLFRLSKLLIRRMARTVSLSAAIAANTAEIIKLKADGTFDRTKSFNATNADVDQYGKANYVTVQDLVRG